MKYIWSIRAGAEEKLVWRNLDITRRALPHISGTRRSLSSWIRVAVLCRRSWQNHRLSSREESSVLAWGLLVMFWIVWIVAHQVDVPIPFSSARFLRSQARRIGADVDCVEA